MRKLNYCYISDVTVTFKFFSKVLFINIVALKLKKKLRTELKTLSVTKRATKRVLYASFVALGLLFGSPEKNGKDKTLLQIFHDLQDFARSSKTFLCSSAFCFRSLDFFSRGVSSFSIFGSWSRGVKRSAN